MSDAQFGALVSALTLIGSGLGIVLKLVASRLAKAWDGQTQATRDNTAAFVRFSEEFARQSELLRHVAEWCDAHTGVRNVPEGIRRRTPARGIPATEYSYGRPRSRSEDDDP